MPHAQIQHARRTTIVFLSILLGVALLFMLVIGWPFITPLSYALIMATVFYPFYQRLLKRTKSTGRAALYSTVIVFLLIVLPVAFLLNIAAVQASAVAHEIAARSAQEGGFMRFLVHLTDKPMHFVGRFVDVSSFDPERQIHEHMKSFGAKLLPTAASWVEGIVSLIASTFLALLAMYFLLRDSEGILQSVTEMLPIGEDYAKRLLSTLKNAIVANVHGVFAVGAAQGTATGIALFAVGVSPAVLLGMVAALCSVVPIVGTGLVWGPAAIYLMATGHMVKGIILLAIGAGVISTLENIIRPLVVGSAVKANGLVLMLSMLGGVAAFGFLGLFVGPVLIALVAAVSSMLKEELRETQQLSSSEVSTSTI
jgi:predicted PurR-regulated permease PerM